MADQGDSHHHHDHHPTIGQVLVPHGPESISDVSDEFVDMAAAATVGDASGATQDRDAIFSYLTQPNDSYTPEGVYWADLPFRQRLSFVSKVDKEEAKKELRSLGRMIKKDPLSPLGWYFRNAVLPGAGLGLEGYVLFSIGNLQTLFAAAWPTCWGKNPTECNPNWIAAVAYLEVVGIMTGQVGVGIIGDWMGRKWGLIQDAVIMFVGLLMLTASWGSTLEGWVICYSWSLFFYSLGVGGEYPITATSSMENAVGAGKISTREDRLHRGRKVTMAFLMQGWGQFFNQALLIILMLILHHGSGSPPYSLVSTQWIFRLSFAFPAVGTLWLIYYRTYKMPHANRALAAAKRARGGVTGYDVQSLRRTVHHFGGRLLATAGTWFANDVFFYGNKLFQSSFISVIDPAGSKNVMTSWLWNMINIGVELAGYYAASFLIDNKMYGRKMMQQVGFFMCFIMFVVPAFKYDYYTSKAGIHSFQAMYFLSSFFNQFGPNSVTFLVAGEVYPTPIRASAHGFSACIGKAGALLAAILYNYIDTQKRFYVVPWFGLAGMLLTWLFLPDTTGLDLKEQERRWRYIVQGRESEYHGIAIHPKHLSLWERLRGVGKGYSPELDRAQMVEDLREEWTEKEQLKRDREAGLLTGDDAVAAVAAEKDAADAARVGVAPTDGAQDGDEFNRDVHDYFVRTAGEKRGALAN